MKRTILWAVLWLGAAGVTFAQESPSWLMFESLNWAGRLDYLKDPKAPSDGAFLLRALETTDSARIDDDRDPDSPIKKEIALRLIRQLADHPVDGTVPLISRIARQYKDPFLRGESWVALAQLKSGDLAPELAQNLTLLNDSGARTRAEEIQAAYAVQAFGILKAQEGFRAVAGASVAWYSPVSQVRETARKILPALTSDFEKSILSLLSDDPDLTFRERLFEQTAQTADPAMTARAAAAALGTLVRERPEGKTDQDTVVRFTLSALAAAGAAASPPPALVPVLSALLENSALQDARTRSVRVLAKIDDPSAVKALSDTLSRFNARQRTGSNTASDLQLVRELFSALAQTGKSAARPALEEARLSSYPPGMVRDAQAAADRLPQ